MLMQPAFAWLPVLLRLLLLPRALQPGTALLQLLLLPRPGARLPPSTAPPHPPLPAHRALRGRLQAAGQRMQARQALPAWTDCRPPAVQPRHRHLLRHWQQQVPELVPEQCAAALARQPVLLLVLPPLARAMSMPLPMCRPRMPPPAALAQHRML